MKIVENRKRQCNASRMWYTSVKEVLLKAAAERSKFDGSIFSQHWNARVQGLICCHVDKEGLSRLDKFNICYLHALIFMHIKCT